ncbi:MAG: 16S rRNA (cytosine(967)-C(5))-methyltransferase RsmB [Clostridium sp.]|jgi:16S rRNA (cytosine967-C5)-methyltransferase|nr:16S rRNA (cytosine(967)-C(5))-methyltransferase RsmB [Clostridium sp.]
MAESIRGIVLDTLLAMEGRKNPSPFLMKSVLDQHCQLPDRDRAFLKRVTEGTVERQTELDYLLGCYVELPLMKMKPLIRCLLRMSLYQLLYLDAVPASAVCNEACKLAQERRFRGLKGFVNGVLRSLARDREKGALPYPKEEEDPVLFLSVRYSMPLWLVRKWLETYGREAAQTILEGLLRIHPVTIRFREDLSQEAVLDYLEQFRAKGVQASAGAYLPSVYSLTHVHGVAALPGFAQGAFLVQDVSSMLCVKAAGICSGNRVLDVCAAPGGKALLAAQMGAEVLARDVSAKKILLLEENILRMKAGNIRTQVWDARVFDPSEEAGADVVFLDLPCSGLGVIGKKRDIKYRGGEDKTEALIALQKEIIRSSWRYVKPGGVLIYSTCTIGEGENEGMYRWIGENFPFVPDSIEPYLPEAVLERKRRTQSLSKAVTLSEEEKAGCIQFLPGFFETDGFFFARMKREKKVGHRSTRDRENGAE